MDIRDNYFVLFGLPVQFAVDLTVLRERLRELQAATHPDRVAAGDTAQQRQAVQLSTHVNMGYDVLKSPLRRATYLLELGGIEVEHNPTLPPSFLMEQIELRERLAEVTDQPDPEGALDALRDEVGNQLKQLELAFAAAWPGTPRDALLAVYEMQFLNKLLTTADDVEDQLIANG